MTAPAALGESAGRRRFIVLGEQDNVATAVEELAAGETLTVERGKGPGIVTLVSRIPFGHKFALDDIPQGVAVLKYGYTIGLATAPIAGGEHVHVHNVEGIKGRGDKQPPQARPSPLPGCVPEVNDEADASSGDMR